MPVVKRETRANLVFLIIFLVVSLPGAVILFRKKLSPSAPPMFMPDVVVHQLPYMAPGETPPGTTRIVPPLTWGSLSRLVRQRTGQPLAFQAGPHGEPLPVLSADRQLQLASVRRETGKTLIDFILWDPSGVINPARDTVTIHMGDQTAAGRIVSAQPVPLETQVRKELRSVGYLNAPDRITWIEAEFPDSLEKGVSSTLTLKRGEGAGAIEETVSIP